MIRNRVEWLDRKAAKALFERSRSLGEGLDFLEERVGKELLERLSRMNLSAGPRLDLGCGEGELLRQLRNSFSREALTVGVDLQPGANGDQVAGDAHRLPFGRGAFGVVVSNLLLPWCDPTVLFREVRRILQPGGAFLFSSFGPETLAELRQVWAAVDDSIHVHPAVDLHDLGDALLHTGFVNPVMDADTLTVEYRSLDKLMSDLRQGGYCNIAADRRRTLTGKNRFMAFRREMEELRNASGWLPVTFEVLYGYARTPRDSIAVAVPR